MLVIIKLDIDVCNYARRALPTVGLSWGIWIACQKNKVEFEKRKIFETIEQKSMTLAQVFLLFILLYFTSVLWGTSKGEENNQSCGQKTCLSARSFETNNNTAKWFLPPFLYMKLKYNQSW